MSRIVEVEPDPSAKERAIREVLVRLAEYDGETVVAGEHPLHKAVVELEKLCRYTKDAKGQLRYYLWPSAKLPWFGLLWASRGIKRVRGSFLQYDKLSEPDPMWAMFMASKLAVELWMELERLAEVER